MSLRCGCSAEGDEIVFGIHECATDPQSLCECGFPFGAGTCPVHVMRSTMPPWRWFHRIGDQATEPRPFETTLDADERGGH